MRPVVFALAAAVALPVLPGAAGAEAQTLVTRVTSDDLVGYVERAGHTVSQVDSNGVPTIGVSAEQGFMYVIQGNACDEAGCEGLKLMAQYDGASGVSLDQINTLNIDVPAMKFWKSDDVLGLERYLILNGGLTDDNIVYELETFDTIVPRMVERLVE